MLPIKKIYIDSRFKSSDSASDSDFKIDLPISFLMQEDTGFYIDDVCIPHTWYPIAERNNVIVFKFNTNIYTAYVPHGNYSTLNLGLAIAQVMNIALPVTDRFESRYDAKTNKLTTKLLDEFKPSNVFQIYTDHFVEEIAPSVAHRTINTMLKNFAQKPLDNSDDVSGYIDMYPFRNIYMTASGLGNFNTVSVAGDRNIVKKTR